MMKGGFDMKMTRNELKYNWGTLFIAHHCALQEIERYMVKIGSNSSLYGWNWDALSLFRSAGRSPALEEGIWTTFCPG
jgi:hypothetical protein